MARLQLTSARDIKRAIAKYGDKAAEKPRQKPKGPRKAPERLAMGANAAIRECPLCDGIVQWYAWIEMRGHKGRAHWFQCGDCHGHFGYADRKPSTPVLWYMKAGTAEVVEIPQES